jgi:hypothetical protein
MVVGNVTVLSHVITLASGSSSSLPAAIAERIPRTARAIGAQVTAERTPMAASRVTAHTGRRRVGAPRSAHTLSPRATTPAWSLQRAVTPLGQRRGPVGSVGMHPEARRQYDAGLLRPEPQWLPCEAAPTGSSIARMPSDPGGTPDHHPAGRAPRVDSWAIWSIKCLATRLRRTVLLPGAIVRGADDRCVQFR